MSTVLKITCKDEVLRARLETPPAYANYVSEMKRLFPAATLAAATFRDSTGQLKLLSASTWEDFLATGTLSASGSVLLKLDVQHALPVDAEAEPGQGDGIPSLLEMEERAEGASCLRGKRIAMMPRGSRGDVQPFVALGSRLRAAGCRVLVLTNADHLDFVAEFGLEAVGVAPDCRTDHEAPEFQHALATGNWVPFMAVRGVRTLTELPEMLAKELAALQDFGPDLVYATPLSWTRARVFARLFAVPMVNGSLQPIEEGQPRHTETKQFDYAWLTSQAELQVIRSVLGKDPRFDTNWTSRRSCRLDFLEPLGPSFVHWSPVLNEVPLHKRDRHAMTGFLVVGQQEQEQCFEGQRDSIFGGEAASELRDFLESGAPPVYLGWGSMVIVSREHMACLAVRALRRAGLRGVILGGWAGLIADLLPGDLREYARANVLFTKSAPHEWLFPRCAVTVHHGGAGTTAAALRAGVPTVITPCGIDQPGIAQRVQASGCGLALGHFPQVTPKQLADALTRCLGDEAMKARCRCMGEFLREEDGVGITVSEIERFMREEVHTGAWQARHEERLLHEHQELGAEKRTQCATQ